MEKRTPEELAAYLREMAEEVPVELAGIGVEHEALTAAADMLEGGTFELVEWTELRDAEEIQVDAGEFGTWELEVEDPLEGIMVVVPDYDMLNQAGVEEAAKIAEILVERSREILKAAGWQGEVILVPSNIKLMRFRRKS